MARPRTVPDAEVYVIIRRLLADGGDKAVAFGTVARATGLAGSTLAQRYGTREGMVQAALMDAWDLLDQAAEAAEGASGSGPKAAQALLKALSTASDGMAPTLLAIDLRNATLRIRAAAWRARIEGALALRLGGGAKGRQAAAMLFALWQGQVLWQGTGDKGFRLKDAVKRLG